MNNTLIDIKYIISCFDEYQQLFSDMLERLELSDDYNEIITDTILISHNNFNDYPICTGINTLLVQCMAETKDLCLENAKLIYDFVCNTKNQFENLLCNIGALSENTDNDNR